jgi:phosphonate transport system permease protein
MTTPHPAVWRPPSFIANPLLRYGVIFAVLAYLVWSIGSLDINWVRVSNGAERAGNMLARMFPPDFSRGELLVRGVLESLQMALAASFIGMILAIPLGICAANNLVPTWMYLCARAVLAVTRTFHEVIIAIFFVKIFGFGPLAGVLTLVVASLSFIGKMLAEDIENMPPGQLEAIRVQPQMLPRYLGVSIYRLDANIRHSTVVGIVGAGGIGQTLAASFSRYDYDFSLAILMTIVSLVFAGEVFSNWVRGRLR